MSSLSDLWALRLVQAQIVPLIREAIQARQVTTSHGPGPLRAMIRHGGEVVDGGPTLLETWTKRGWQTTRYRHSIEWIDSSSGCEAAAAAAAAAIPNRLSGLTQVALSVLQLECIQSLFCALCCDTTKQISQIHVLSCALFFSRSLSFFLSLLSVSR